MSIKSGICFWLILLTKVPEEIKRILFLCDLQIRQHSPRYEPKTRSEVGGGEQGF